MESFKTKMLQIHFGYGSAPDPTEGAYSALPSPLAAFERSTSKGRDRNGREDKEKEMGKGKSNYKVKG